MPLIKAEDGFASKWEILLYGVPGVGKTTLFADAPRVLYIEVDDNGHIVLQDHRNAADINVYYTRSWSELVKFAVALPTSRLIESVDTIVVDTISECQVLERLKEVGGEPLSEDKWKFNQNIFTINNFRIQALVRKIKECGKNVAWLCHETTELVGKEQEKLIRPALSATLLAAVQANLDGQFYYTRRGMNRVLETDGLGTVQTKSRFASSRPLVNPTWPDLARLLTSRMQPKHS
jgi:AAA domain